VLSCLLRWIGKPECRAPVFAPQRLHRASDQYDEAPVPRAKPSERCMPLVDFQSVADAVVERRREPSPPVAAVTFCRTLADGSTTMGSPAARAGSDQSVSSWWQKLLVQLADLAKGPDGESASPLGSISLNRLGQRRRWLAEAAMSAVVAPPGSYDAPAYQIFREPRQK
jgi:hypothetical protein